MKLDPKACELCTRSNVKLPGKDGKMDLCCKCILLPGKSNFKPRNKKSTHINKGEQDV